MELLTKLNWTSENVIMVVLALLIVEAMHVTGRGKDNGVRLPFSPAIWAKRKENIASLVLSIGCSFALLAFRDGLVSSMGLSVTDMTAFGNYYAFGVGAFGQAMMRMALKAFEALFRLRD